MRRGGAVPLIALGFVMSFHTSANAQTTIVVKSDSSTLGAATPADPTLLDSAAGASGLTFQPVEVEPGGTRDSLPIPPGAPSGTVVVNIAPRNFDQGLSGYFKVTFDLPAGFSSPQLNGAATIDNAGRVFLNGNPITASIFSSAFDVVNRYSFATSNAAFFKAGTNEILISNYNLMPFSPPNPSGAAFYLTVTYQTVPADFILITPNIGVVSGSQQFTAIGFRFRTGGIQTLPAGIGNLDPEDPADQAALAAYDRIGPVPCNWQLDNSQAKAGDGPPEPILEFDGAAQGASAVTLKVTSAAKGGTLRPGLVATTSQGKSDSTLRVVVPWISSISIDVLPTQHTWKQIVPGKVALMPDRFTPDDSLDNEIQVTAQIEPGDDPKLIGKSVQFWSIDADDEDVDPAGVNTPDTGDVPGFDDNRATIPADMVGKKRGILFDPDTRVPGVTDDHFVGVSQLGKRKGTIIARAALRTTLNQGDNWRVVGTFVPAQRFAAVAPDPSRFGEVQLVGGGLVPDSRKAGAAFSSYWSTDLVTIWRRVNITIQVMLPVTSAEQMKPTLIDGPQLVTGTVQDVSASGLKVTVKPDVSVVDSSSGVAFPALVQGVLGIGKNEWSIESITPVTGSDSVVVGLKAPARGALPGKSDLNQTCEIRDDDDLGLLPADRDHVVRTFLGPYLARLNPEFVPESNVFAPVFLVPEVSIITTNSRVAFRSHTTLKDRDDLATAMASDGKTPLNWPHLAQNTDDTFYACYAVIAYQHADTRDTAGLASAGHDNDPNDEGLPGAPNAIYGGETSIAFGASAIFVECQREMNFLSPGFAKSEFLLAHEICHSLGVGGEDGSAGDLMPSAQPLGPNLTVHDRRNLRAWHPTVETDDANLLFGRRNP